MSTTIWQEATTHNDQFHLCCCDRQFTYLVTLSDRSWMVAWDRRLLRDVYRGAQCSFMQNQSRFVALNQAVSSLPTQMKPVSICREQSDSEFHSPRSNVDLKLGLFKIADLTMIVWTWGDRRWEAKGKRRKNTVLILAYKYNFSSPSWHIFK